jgi:hypothetical protein
MPKLLPSISTTQIAALASAIERYELSYFQTIRDSIQRHPGIEDAIPGYLRGFKRIVACIGTNGAVVARYPDKLDSFSFQQTPMDVSSIATKLSDGIVEFNVGFDEAGKLSVGGLQLATGEEENRREFKVTDWDFLTITNDLRLASWQESKAAFEAAIDVQTFIAARLTKMEDPRPDSLLAHLRKSVRGLEQLLGTSPSEEDLQKYLNEHPILLCHDAIEVNPKVKLGSEHVTDYVVRRGGTDYILVEIEPSEHPLFTKSGDPTRAC